MDIFPCTGDSEVDNETMVQKDSGGQKASCGHVNVRVRSGEARNPGPVLKTGCLHNLVEGHGQILSREMGWGDEWEGVAC